MKLFSERRKWARDKILDKTVEYPGDKHHSLTAAFFREVSDAVSVDFISAVDHKLGVNDYVESVSDAIMDDLKGGSFD